ncbi:hypothetical protein AMJ47_04070 [Parcubacteria bacterium DG_72]|nr:MAG: hypothetical protein AMJ47_04070 [Parcubacteria bacterium DG_72]
MTNTEHLPIYLKSYQLIKFLYGRTRSFPKEYKYTLGEEILGLVWQCIDNIIEANILPDNKKYFKISELSCSFDKLKTRLRMAQEIGLISVKQYGHIQTYYMKEIGEEIGGWLKWAFSQKQ